MLHNVVQYKVVNLNRNKSVDSAMVFKKETRNKTLDIESDLNSIVKTNIGGANNTNFYEVTLSCTLLYLYHNNYYDSAIILIKVFTYLVFSPTEFDTYR